MDDRTDKANPYIVAVDGFFNVNLFLNKIRKIDKLTSALVYSLISICWDNLFSESLLSEVDLYQHSS